MFEGPPPNAYEETSKGVATLLEDEVAKSQQLGITPEELEAALLDLGVAKAPEQTSDAIEVAEGQPESLSPTSEQESELPAPEDLPQSSIVESPSADFQAWPTSVEATVEEDQSDSFSEPEPELQEEFQRPTPSSIAPDVEIARDPLILHGTHFDRMHGSMENVRDKAFGSGILGLLNFVMNPRAWLRYRRLKKEFRNSDLAKKTHFIETWAPDARGQMQRVHVGADRPRA